MDYIKAAIATTKEGIDVVGAILLELETGGYEVQDPDEFKQFLDTGRWDYIDDSVMGLLGAATLVTAYLPVNEQGRLQLENLKAELERLKVLNQEGQWGSLEVSLSNLKEEDWAEAWKQYYHPTPIGKRLVICPSWEEYSPAPGQVVLQMDPGMAFGTGTHQSTKLCLSFLENAVRPGDKVLDIGCGSGILGIAALLLGAESSLGVDIDEVAVRTAKENAQRNQVQTKASFRQGSLVENVTGAYNLVFANIVADVIIRLCPDVPKLLLPGGVFIVSGIITPRAGEVRAALEAQGFVVRRTAEDGGWTAMEAVVAASAVVIS